VEREFGLGIDQKSSSDTMLQ